MTRFLVDWNGHRSYSFKTSEDAKHFTMFWIPFEYWIDKQKDLPDIIRGDVAYALYENFITKSITIK